MRHTLIPLEAREEWDRALDGVPHAFAHTWGSCHAMSLSTGYPTHLYVFVEDNVRIACPVAERELAGYIDIVTPYGFSGFTGTADHAGFPTLWREFAAERGWVCGYIALNPLFERPSLYDPEDASRLNELYVLDLTASEPELLARLSENRIREIKAWQTRPDALVIDRDALVEFVVRENQAFFDSRGAAGVYRLGDRAWRALLELPDVMLVGAAVNGRIAAVSTFGFTEFTGDYLFSVSTPDGRGFGAALVWEGALRLRALGVPSLNLGGGVRPGDGVARFKQRFGPSTLPFTSLRQVYDIAVYGELSRRAGADPDARAGYFPPYRRP